MFTKKRDMMELDRKTIEDDEDYLRQISTDIDFNHDNLNLYVEQLKEYCDSHYCYALAPVQIGIPKRIIYIKNSSQNMDNNTTKGYDESLIYINPVIIAAKGLTNFLEGCESCIYHKDGKIIHYVGVVDRPYSIKIEYYDILGKKKTIEGFEATVFFHEYDHLNGILHMDRVSNIYEMTIEEMKAYRIEHPYDIISKDEPYQLVKNKKIK